MPPETNQLPRVRTFEQDVAESMQTKQASVLHVALAEQERAEEVFIETKKKRGSLFLYLISFILILSAIGVTGYVYFFYNPLQRAILPEGVLTAADSILSDETISVEVDLKNRSNSLALLAATSSIDTTLGTVTKIVPYVSETSEDGTKKNRAITSQEFFALIGTTVPEIFIRSLTQDISFVRVIDEGMHAGIVVETNDYDRTVVGLTDWEKTIISDFEKVFGYTRRIETKELIETIRQTEVVNTKEIYDPKTKKTRLVTSTTTEPVSTFEEKITSVSDEIFFTNAVRKNIELRIAKGRGEKEYLVYGFPERSTLVLAGSVETFLRIVERLPGAKENMIE